MSRAVQIRSVLSTWPHVAFTGDVDDGRRLRFVAPKGESMPRTVAVGETWTIEGSLVQDPVHGEQVRVESARLERPSGRVIVDLLSGDRFPGIGAITAGRLWKRLGEDLYAALDRDDGPALAEALGEDRKTERQVAVLLDGWRDLGVEIEVLAWLGRNAVPPKLAGAAAACFGESAVAAIEGDPYRLCLVGGGWDEVDVLAVRLGIAQDDRRRLAAAVDHCVTRRFIKGDTVVATGILESDVGRLLGAKLAAAAVAAAAEDLSLLPVDGGWQGHGPAAIEQFVATALVERLAGGGPAVAEDRAAALAWAEREGLVLNEGQLSAVAGAHGLPVAMIVGGAGTGKTTVLRAVADLAEGAGDAVTLMALSGRAALRMSEATGRPAATIASFLAGVRSRGRSARPRGVVVVDEASMVDVVLIYRVLLAIGGAERILLVGDPGQLPPIGPGLTLHELVRSPTIPTFELAEILRQAAETGIPGAGESVRRGVCPPAFRVGGSAPGVELVACADEDLPESLLFLRDEAEGDVQIIAALKGDEDRGSGTRRINALLHGRIASGDPSRNARFHVGEPVIFTRNDYDLGLMNGEMGTVLAAGADGGVEVAFGAKRASLGPRFHRVLDLAYAVTVHKAQGSEFDIVIVPVVDHPFFDRTLIYTALTRARRKAVFVGDPATLERAIRAAPIAQRRRSALGWHLQRAAAVPGSP